MKITKIQIEKFSIPFTEPFQVAFGLITDSESWTVKVMTDEGVYGLGSAAPWDSSREKPWIPVIWF